MDHFDVVSQKSDYNEKNRTDGSEVDDPKDNNLAAKVDSDRGTDSLKDDVLVDKLYTVTLENKSVSDGQGDLGVNMDTSETSGIVEETGKKGEKGTSKTKVSRAQFATVPGIFRADRHNAPRSA